MSDSPTCIYIASRGHSGSTLLEVLLARHNAIAAAGEVANLGLQCVRDAKTSWSGQCGCGLGPFECEIWSAVMKRIEAESGIDMRTNPFDFRVSDIGREEELTGRSLTAGPLVWARKKYWRLIRQQQYQGIPPFSTIAALHTPQEEWARNRALVLSELAKLQNASAVVDSSKDALGMRDMHDYSGMNVKILFLTRDCRGNAWSFVKRTGAENEGRHSALKRASKDWTKVNKRILRLLSNVPKQNWIQVKYEDLCRSPQETLETICQFINLEYDPSMLSGREETAHTIAGNRIRLSNKSAQISEDKRWKENMTDADEDVVRRAAGTFAREVGYEF